MNQSKQLISHRLGSSSSAATTHSCRNPLKQAAAGLDSKLSRIREVLERAGWNSWIEREDDEVWRWLENVRRLEDEIRVEMEKWRPEIAQAAGGDPAVAVKVLYSIPFLRSCVKRLKVQDHILLIVKELSRKIESGFKDDDVTRFDKLSYPDSESAARYKPPLTTCDLSVLPVWGQISEKDDLLKKYFFQTSDKRRSMISITGEEGSGKTTLAQMVYHDERVRDHFQIRKWVCVADSFDHSSMNRIRRELAEGEYIGEDDGERICRSSLYEKRFLLVLDDVHDNWGGSDSCLFRESLINSGAPGSVILVTSTRDDFDAFNEHKVAPLSTSDCWSIVKRVALSGKPELHRLVRNIGRELAEGCRGSPVSSGIMGDFLKSKETVQEWKDAVGDDQIWNMMGVLPRTLVSYFLESYDKLSPSLKECLSYCAVFPTQFQINVGRLVALWAAMGYIGEKRGYDAMVELLEMSYFFADVRRSVHTNKITSWKLREAYYVTAKQAFPELTMAEQLKNLYSETPSLHSFVIVSHCHDLPGDLFRRLKYVKALVLCNCKLEQISGEVGSLDLLRLLDLSGNPLKRLPETIGGLKCLESLYLHSCYLLPSLPQRIGDLKYLRNLRISYTTDELHNLPQGFEELTSIRTLDVFRVGGTYDNVSKLKKLNHLVDIRIAVHGEVCFSDADLENKREMENLELCFVGKGRDQEMAACVEKLAPPPNLEMLLIEDYHGLKLPMWINLAESLINKLKRLSMKSVVNINSLPDLWKLSSLEFLWIYDMPKITHLGCEFFGLPEIQHQQKSNQKMSRDDGEGRYQYYSDDEDVQREISWKEEDGKREAFRSLKTLRIEYLGNLAKWEDVDKNYETQIKVMPSLEEIIILDCPKLEGRPLRILQDTPWFEKCYQGGFSKHLTDVAVHVGGKHSSNLEEVAYVDDFLIRIDIHGDVNFRDADLQNKAETEYLELRFVGNGRNPDVAKCVEELKPPQNLEVLKMVNYPGPRLPKWVTTDSFINRLICLNLRSCPNISSFPSLWKLPRLESLLLFDIPSMKCLGLEFFGCSRTGQHEEIGGGETAFPSLETLEIQYLHNWETWVDVVVEGDQRGIKVMPSLQELIIADCPKLQGKPLRILRDTPWFKKHHKPQFFNRLGK